MDLVNWIAHMRGPEFLVVYAIYCAIALCLAALWARRCDPLPPFAAMPADPHAGSDPYEFAWLRDDARGVLVTALFSLRQRGAVRIDNHVAYRAGDPGGPLDRAEMLVYGALAEPRRLSELIKNAMLRAAVSRESARYAAKYAAAGFATSPSERRRALAATAAGLAAVLGLGAFKLTAALSTGHRNVGFLIAIGVAVSVAVVVVCAPRRLNARGRAYLKQLKETYRPWSQGVGVNPASETMLPLYVGLLGTGVLAGTRYDDLSRELRAARASNGGSCGGGCASSCSSGGDGGGGGCGGGGCGGGCGGCGG